MRGSPFFLLEADDGGIRLSQPCASCTITITDLLGQIVLHDVVRDVTSFNVRDLLSGWYVIQIVDRSSLFVRSGSFVKN